jgi:hypothetical protein
MSGNSDESASGAIAELDGAHRQVFEDAMDDARPKRRLSPAAERALAEARARRAKIDARVAKMPKERDGRKGPEPVRYGDWEVKGIASDFS